MNSSNYRNTDKLLSAAACILESRLYPPPPDNDTLKSMYSLSDEYNNKVISMSQFIISKRARRTTVRTIIIAAAIIALLIIYAICMGAHEGTLFSMERLDVFNPDGTLQYTEFRSEHDVISFSDISIVVFPEYIPEGFTCDISYKNPTNIQKYINGDNYFYFAQTSFYSVTEFGSGEYPVNEVQIGENIAYYIEVPTQNYTSIIMDCSYGHIKVRGTIPIEESIKILENIAP